MESSRKTPNETPNSIQYADFPKRLKAFAYDYIFICGYIILLSVMTMIFVKIAGLMGLVLSWPTNPVLADLMAFITLVLPVILYFSLQESSPRQASWGKRKVNLRVVNANGGRLTRNQSFVRSLVKMIPWQIGHTCLFQVLAVTPTPPAVVIGYVLLYLLVGFYILSAWISKKHRTPYDWAAGSYVVVENS